ncbi:MAG: hypothetical protein D3909_01050 [Candidatus Electrothrix sp. ATG1]|nr:hypothetical protein [Candidatus Electrothrix sp. ATG1]
MAGGQRSRADSPALSQRFSLFQLLFSLHQGFSKNVIPVFSVGPSCIMAAGYRRSVIFLFITVGNAVLYKYKYKTVTSIRERNSWIQ